MKIGAVSGIAALAVLAASQSGAQSPKPTVPAVMQGKVLGVTGAILNVDFGSAHLPHGRQVDISGATYESPSGTVVVKYPIAAGDSIMIVVDPNAPTTYRPKPVPGKPMPMFIRLLPLKALVVEKVLGSTQSLPGSNSG